MIIFASVLIPITLLAIFIFFRTSPINVNKKKTRITNAIILGIAIVGCIVASFYSYFTTGRSVDSAWWPVLAFFSSIIVFTLILVVGGAYRNFFHYK
jgi:hypothetical protein